MMGFRTSRGGVKLFFLLPGLIIAVGLGYYIHVNGLADFSFVRKWQVEATNLFKKTTSQPEQAQEKILTLDLDELSAGLNEEQVSERFRAVQLSCYSVRDPLGDSTCTTPLALFNDSRARMVSFFFSRDRLANLRVTFPVDQQQELSTRLQGKYGQPAPLGFVDPHTGRKLQGWKLSRGTLGITEIVTGDRETVLLWMANPAAARASGRP